MVKKQPSAARAAEKTAARRPRFVKWSRTFLAELASTSNVTAAARKAGINTSTAYEARRADAQFNRAWQQALCEGYEHLEMETLGRLRSGELKPAAGSRRAARSYDNGLAIRLLLAHRDAAAQQRAIRDNEDAEAILVSIDAKLDNMRERSLAQRKARDAQ